MVYFLALLECHVIKCTPIKQEIDCCNWCHSIISQLLHHYIVGNYHTFHYKQHLDRIREVL